MPNEIRSARDLHEILDTLAQMDRGWLKVGGNGLREIPLERIRFDGWPRLDITIRGEKFVGGMPARIMPALYKYQWVIDRALARSLHTSARGLTTKDRKSIELIIGLNQGSTSFDSDLSAVLNNAIDVIKQRADPLTIVVILTLAGMVQGAGVWKAHIEAEAKRHQMAYHVQLSQEETKRLQTIATLAENFSHVRANRDDMGETQNALLRCLDDRDELFVGNEFIVDGRVGKRIARKPRDVREEGILDSEFFIETVHTGPERSGYQVHLREAGSSTTLRILIPDGGLPPNLISVLRQAEWDKKPVRMQIHVATVGGDVVEATLVGLNTR